MMKDAYEEQKKLLWGKTLDTFPQMLSKEHLILFNTFKETFEAMFVHGFNCGVYSERQVTKEVLKNFAGRKIMSKDIN